MALGIVVHSIAMQAALYVAMGGLLFPIIVADTDNPEDQLAEATKVEKIDKNIPHI